MDDDNHFGSKHKIPEKKFKKILELFQKIFVASASSNFCAHMSP